MEIIKIIQNAINKSSPLPYSSVYFIPKKISNDPNPWIRFGSSKLEYEKWIPEVCGICCLKMIGDTFNKTNKLSLYELTLKVLKKGGFKIKDTGEIQGVFHYPLLKTAHSLGLKGKVIKKLSNKKIIENLKNNKLAILSINLNKVNQNLKSGHLVLIHSYNKNKDEFTLHDCANIINMDGKNINISSKQLHQISNNKGLIIWNC